MIEFNFASLLPEIVVAGTALTVLILEVVLSAERRGALRWVGLLGMAAAFLAVDDAFGTRSSGFFAMVSMDDFSMYLDAALLLGAGLTVLLSRRSSASGGYTLLLLLSLLGMMILVKASDLLLIFLGIETLSLSLYVLAGITKAMSRPLEAAFKYFLLGSFSSAFLLFGIALLYGLLGSTNLFEIMAILARRKEIVGDPVFLVSMGLMFIGFAFKVGAVPFHMWVPDVYEGAPTPVTAFMSVGTKAAAFAAFARLLFTALSGAEVHWSGVLWGLAVATMVLGNLIALAQDNIKRMLAYSSIAHAGYLLVALTSGSDIGLMSLLYYLMVYTLTNVGAFGAVMLLERREKDPTGPAGLLIRDYAGLGWRHPMIGLALSIFLISLTGVPPTAGFVGKFYIFSAAIRGGYLWLAVIGVLMSAVSAYYYLRVVYVMYMQEPQGEPAAPHDLPGVHVVLALAACGVLWYGVLPKGLLSLAYKGARSILF